MKPNKWSCLLEAFSEVSGYSCNELIRSIGHDGSQILFPELPEPLKRKGFNPQEIIDVLYDRDLFVCEIVYDPIMVYSNGKKQHMLPFKAARDKRLIGYLSNSNGVITGVSKTGKGHAFINKKGVIIDPDTDKICIIPDEFLIESYFMVVK